MYFIWYHNFVCWCIASYSRVVVLCFENIGIKLRCVTVDAQAPAKFSKNIWRRWILIVHQSLMISVNSLNLSISWQIWAALCKWLHVKLATIFDSSPVSFYPLNSLHTSVNNLIQIRTLSVRLVSVVLPRTVVYTATLVLAALQTSHQATTCAVMLPAWLHASYSRTSVARSFDYSAIAAINTHKAQWYAAVVINL